MSSHSDLPLEPLIANWAVERQLFVVRGHVFGQMVFPEEPFLANATLERFDTGVSHSMTSHIGTIGKFHIAYVALERFLLVIFMTPDM
jgi:hypothetical protein